MISRACRTKSRFCIGNHCSRNSATRQLRNPPGSLRSPLARKWPRPLKPPSHHYTFCGGEYESPCHFVTSPFRQGGREAVWEIRVGRRWDFCGGRAPPFVLMLRINPLPPRGAARACGAVRWYGKDELLNFAMHGSRCKKTAPQARALTFGEIPLTGEFPGGGNKSAERKNRGYAHSFHNANSCAPSGSWPPAGRTEGVLSTAEISEGEQAGFVCRGRRPRRTKIQGPSGGLFAHTPKPSI